MTHSPTVAATDAARKRVGAVCTAALSALCVLAAGPAGAQEGLTVDFGAADSGGYGHLLLLFAAIALAPAVLAVVTSFARIAIVLFFMRAGLGSNEIPPTVVIIGLAIFLTLFTMAPQMSGVYSEALVPYMAGDLQLDAAASIFVEELRGFMSEHTRPSDLAVFADFAPERDADQVTPMNTVVPAYIISELRAAFLIGFIIYLPFVIIDLVVGSTLASIGLVSLPAPAIALPFKVLLFVMVDGWALLTHSLLATML